MDDSNLCPGCGARRIPGGARCPACDLPFPRAWAERLAERFVPQDDGWKNPEHPWFCPRCPKAPLVPRQYRGLELRTCRGCLGMLVRHQALDRLRESDEVRARVLSAVRPLDGAAPVEVEAPAEVQKPVDCPACRKTMARVQFAQVSAVVIDVCATHGLWLDEGELERIASFLQSSELGRTRAEPKRLLGMSAVTLVSDAGAKTWHLDVDWGEVGAGALELLFELILALLFG